MKKIKFTRKQIKIIIACLFLIAFVLIMEDVLENEYIDFDRTIYNFLHHNNYLTIIMKYVTMLGEPFSFIIITFILVFIYKDKIFRVSLPINLFLITILNQCIKFIVKRPRPLGINLIEVNGYSFPSGHTMASIAFYGLLIYFIYKKVKNKKIRYFSITLLILLTLLIAISRIYLGVHYASDVIGGITIGISYLIIFTNIIKEYLEGLNENNK